MTKRVWVVALAVLASSAMVLRAQEADRFERDDRVRAFLTGAEETPPISTRARGFFSAKLSNSGSIAFKLTFEGLTAAATVAHIHYGQQGGVAGGVMIFLCGGGGQPACPAATEGSIEGTITAANVTGPATQGIAPGELAEALFAIGQGLGYVNVHNATFTGGEIRGQIKVRWRDYDN